MKFSLTLIFAAFTMIAIAGEGMWPVKLDSITFKDMQEKGFRLTASDVYNTVQPSLKDAVILFGDGCTGAVISDQGLIITNHHCGYSRLQAHSTIEHNYLTNGFWAASTSEELPNPDLTVTFLVKMEDVTSRVLSGVSDNLTERESSMRLNENIQKIRSEATTQTGYYAEVKPLFFGNEYFLYVYQIFNDVRLVAAPPETIGNFGGDTDNWIWPRYTGDFMIFRIYAGKDNKPAGFSKDNVPYKPVKHFNISTSGVKEGDFTMVLGYPAQTDEYLTSDAISMIAVKALPGRVKMRTQVLESIQSVIDKGTVYKLRYSARHKSIANAWKKWMGVTKGVERADIFNRKQNKEKEFIDWASNLKTDSAGYSEVIPGLKKAYSTYAPLYVANSLAGETLNLLEISRMTDKVQRDFYTAFDSSENFKKTQILQIQKTGRGFFKGNGLEIDRKDLPVLLSLYSTYVDSAYHPAFYKTIKSEFNNDYDKYVSWIYENSLFTDSVRFKKAFSKSYEKIRNSLISDPLLAIYRDYSILLLGNNESRMDSLEYVMKKYYRKYVSGMMAMNPQERLYPDANFTMRVAYGKAEGYRPADAVDYLYQTTVDGIIDKEDPEITDYRVSPELKQLNRQRDFGPWGVNGKMPVCFIASNHTSGGNSGSPVLNAKGELIGVNFDRNWEGTVSDYAFDPDFCRNITVDIRYVLFVIDKYAGNDRLINELTLVK
ncbi:MAG TPA: S46 family peptidase [Bacteroidales bacterium]|nr:S46 family peptidase [Bacteroidales bacterium]